MCVWCLAIGSFHRNNYLYYSLKKWEEPEEEEGKDTLRVHAVKFFKELFEYIFE